MQRFIAVLILACLALASPPSMASTTASSAIKPDAAEVAYVALLDEAIAPVRDRTPAVEQLQVLRDAIGAANAKEPAKAKQLRDQLKDPAAVKLVDWHRLRVGYGDAGEYRAFLEQNPHWPDRVMIGRRFEEALFTQGGSANLLRESLKGREPQSGLGYAALASLALAEGDQARARTFAAKAWREHEIPALLETGFLQRLGPLLTSADHRWRFDVILTDDPRWSKDREERAVYAKRQIGRLADGERKKAEARYAVFTRAGNAQKLMDAIPATAAKDDWGFAFQRAQLLRRAGKTEAAVKLVLSAPIDPSRIVNADGWWEERRLLAYAALKADQPQQAYDLTRAAGPLAANPLKEQTFMAGWLALRRLGNPKAAIGHFTELRKAADGPLSVARAEYWLGRTREVLGEAQAAKAHYQAAAEKFDTFHGQLARQKLTQGAQALPVKPPAAPTPDEIKRFNANDAVQAAVLARKAGLDSAIIRTLLGGLRNGLKSEAELAMNAHLAEALGDTQMAVRVAKTAVAQGKNLITYAYPVHPFPAYKPLRDPPELAFLLAIARQESEFNTQIVSGAGARGLLQVMPITAKHVCRDYKIKCEIERLLTDKPYNTMLASAYIGDRMREFAGSYVLSMAGYNAGPGRARQWVREFGDPRDAKVDPIDWIERIPFTETREYVAKVLANVQIYRARLGEGARALRLEEDLFRARGKAALPAAAGGNETGTAGGVMAGRE